ncbi:5696_t:CDS:2 [Entrophospora sp. SA101]|nr:5696_t:CDS:2 [Entrophospora sp. SA101]
MSKFNPLCTIIVTIIEGKYFPQNPNAKLFVECRFTDEVLSTISPDSNSILSTDSVDQSSFPIWDTELAWEVDQKTLHTLRLQWAHLKLQSAADRPGKEKWISLLNSRSHGLPPEIKISFCILSNISPPSTPITTNYVASPIPSLFDSKTGEPRSLDRVCPMYNAKREMPVSADVQTARIGLFLTIKRIENDNNNFNHVNDIRTFSLGNNNNVIREQNNEHKFRVVIDLESINLNKSFKNIYIKYSYPSLGITHNKFTQSHSPIIEPNQDVKLISGTNTIDVTMTHQRLQRYFEVAPLLMEVWQQQQQTQTIVDQKNDIQIGVANLRLEEVFLSQTTKDEDGKADVKKFSTLAPIKSVEIFKQADEHIRFTQKVLSGNKKNSKKLDESLQRGEKDIKYRWLELDRQFEMKRAELEKNYEKEKLLIKSNANNEELVKDLKKEIEQLKIQLNSETFAKNHYESQWLKSLQVIAGTDGDNNNGDGNDDENLFWNELQEIDQCWSQVRRMTEEETVILNHEKFVLNILKEQLKKLNV